MAFTSDGYLTSLKREDGSYRAVCVSPAWNGQKLSCAAYPGTTWWDRWDNKGGLAGTATDGVTECRCPKGKKWDDSVKACVDWTCTNWDTNECGTGYYCKFGSPSSTNGECDESNANFWGSSSGLCIPIKNLTFSQGDKDYFATIGWDPNLVVSADSMNWWSANSYCVSQGKELVSPNQWGCYAINSNTPSSDTQCYASYSENASPKRLALKDSYPRFLGRAAFWMDRAWGVDSDLSCRAWYMASSYYYTTDQGRVYRTDSSYALCVSPEWNNAVPTACSEYVGTSTEYSGGEAGKALDGVATCKCPEGKWWRNFMCGGISCVLICLAVMMVSDIHQIIPAGRPF